MVGLGLMANWRRFSASLEMRLLRRVVVAIVVVVVVVGKVGARDKGKTGLLRARGF